MSDAWQRRQPAGRVAVGRVGYWLVAGLLAAAVASVSLVPRAAADEAVIDLLELVIDVDVETARECLSILTGHVQSGQSGRDRLAALQPRLQPMLGGILDRDDHPLRIDAAILAAGWQDDRAVALLRETLGDDEQPDGRRRAALRGLIAAGDGELFETIGRLLESPERVSIELRRGVLADLGRLESPEVARVVLERYDRLEPPLAPHAVELLTQRRAWSLALLEAIAAGRVSSSALNANQLRNLLALGDARIESLVHQTWGVVRQQRDPAREQRIAEIRALLDRTPGDAHRGQEVFHRVCAQCHRMHGEGVEVGPDITANGRGSYEQLLSNVFDPSLVIGASYQAHLVLTIDGRVLTGLVVEDSDQRIVLNTQGGKLETIARQDIEEVRVSELSMMPEDLESQLTDQELADLFAFLTLDRPPSDPSSRPIAGAEHLHR